MITFIIVSILCAIIIWHVLCIETFATPSEKKSVLGGYLATHPNVPYTKYLRDNPSSNIVEFLQYK